MSLRYTVFLSLVLAAMFVSATSAHAKTGTLEVKFLQAATTGDSSTVRAMLAQGADIESRDANGRSALLLATRHKAIDVALDVLGGSVEPLRALSALQYKAACELP